MARSEYSHLRGIAQRRIDRLVAAGLAPQGTRFPTVKELGSSKSAQQKALNAINRFLASGSTLRETRQSGKRIGTVAGTPAVLTEKQLREQARREKISATLKERYKTLRNLSDSQRSALKGARSIGLNIPTSEINTFLEYVEYRYAQNKDSSWYTVVDDYATLQEKKKTSRGSLLQDFDRFRRDREDLMNMYDDGTPGFSSRMVNQMWTDFINE